MNKIEFFTDPNNVVCVKEDDVIRPLDKVRNERLINTFLEKFASDYPSNYGMLQAIFEDLELNKPAQRFRMAEQLCRCSFPKFDSVPDINELGEFRFEKSDCPLRNTAHCPFKESLCNLTYRAELTQAERAVASLLCRGLGIEEVAKQLSINYECATKRRHNVYRRVGVNTQPELMAWAKRTGIFDNE